jgi:hypothetical protein
MYLGFPSLGLLIAKPGGSGKYDGNRPPVGEIREPCFNWNVIPSRHSRIEASLYAQSNNRLRDRKTKSLVLLCYQLTYVLLVYRSSGLITDKLPFDESCELCAITPVNVVRVIQDGPLCYLPETPGNREWKCNSKLL